MIEEKKDCSRRGPACSWCYSGWVGGCVVFGPFPKIRDPLILCVGRLPKFLIDIKTDVDIQLPDFVLKKAQASKRESMPRAYRRKVILSG